MRSSREAVNSPFLSNSNILCSLPVSLKVATIDTALSIGAQHSERTHSFFTLIRYICPRWCCCFSIHPFSSIYLFLYWSYSSFTNQITSIIFICTFSICVIFVRYLIFLYKWNKFKKTGHNLCFTAQNLFATIFAPAK